ncbi:CD5 antigen-like [Sphaeramia orbicularis]|uniref:CD5 antigen-like n=1 Tax=Sphaeramia orbicularis TaxID=375764 RepID=UPI00117CA6D3|nr:CD5 antigen-like [Sphaeramia orbicularis]
MRLDDSSSQSAISNQGPQEPSVSRSWSSVCEGHLDLHGAQVVCRELGCGAPGLLQGALYGEAEALVVQTFQCKGHESALLDCGSAGSETCSSGTAVDLTCTDPDDVRLVGGTSRCNGVVEIKHHGEWRYMGNEYYYSDPWTLKAADVICRRLDCGSAVSGRRPGSSDHVWSIRPTCLLSTSTLRDCVRTDPDSRSSPLFLTCSACFLVFPMSRPDPVQEHHGPSPGALRTRSGLTSDTVRAHLRHGPGSPQTRSKLTSDPVPAHLEPGASAPRTVGTRRREHQKTLCRKMIIIKKNC